jgi:hypothetical protein
MSWLWLLWACDPGEPVDTGELPSWEAPACPQVSAAEEAGTVEDDALTELSGLVASRAHPGRWWAHNDSGDSPRLFALGDDGADLGRVDLPDATAFDWEDIARLPGGDRDRIFVADIGDNARIRQQVTLWEVAEPAPDDTVAAVVAHALRYPDGARDAETLLADPLEGTLWVVSKSDQGSGLYRADLEAGTLDFTLSLPFGQGALEEGGPLATGGDVSGDGLWVVVRTYNGAWLWPRDPARPLAAAFENDPCRVDLLIEPQGESIAFTAEDAALVTISEGRNEPVYWYGVAE